MEKKFITVLESAMTRFTRGGFLVGDLVIFKKGYEKEKAFQELGSNVKAMIAEMLDSGLHIRIVGIKNMNPVIYPGNAETTNGLVSLDVALDHMGGRYSHYVTIPVCCVEAVDSYPNLASVPDCCVANDKTILKPEEVKRDEKKTQTTHVKGGNYELGGSDVKNKFAKQPYTSSYLTGLKNF